VRVLACAGLASCATTGGARELTFADLLYVDTAGQPAPLDLARFYPDAAMRMEMDGRAVVRCQVMQDRTLQSCLVVSESPPGYRFGNATVRVASRLRAKPEVEITDGQTALLSVGWTIPRA
jgi:protein TonB